MIVSMSAVVMPGLTMQARMANRPSTWVPARKAWPPELDGAQHGLVVCVQLRAGQARGPVPETDHAEPAGQHLEVGGGW